MNNIIVESARDLVIDLPLLKSHLRIGHDYEDDYLKNIIEMATIILENKISESILEKTYSYTHYPKIDIFEPIELPCRHIIKIISIQSFNEGNTTPLDYKILYDEEIMKIQINVYNTPINIKYKAGIVKEAVQVPVDLKFAVLQIAKNIYECSEEDVLESKYIKDIIRSYRSLKL